MRTGLITGLLIAGFVGGLFTAAVVAAETVHFNDFESEAGPAWSTQEIASPPGENATRFLGRFSEDQNAALTLTDLPKHTRLRVTFDLHIIQTWDGENTTWGPDRWIASVDGRELIRTSFSNADWNNYQYFQNFPGLLASERFNHRTGADRIDTLNFENTDEGNERLPLRDATYQLRMTIAHSADTAELVFRGSGLQELSDESWGIDNIRVEVLSDDDIEPLTDEQWQRISRDLSGTDPRKIYDACWLLIEQGDAGLNRIDEMLTGREDSRNARRQHIQQLIDQLNAPDYETREQAMSDLQSQWRLEPDLLTAAAEQPASAEAEWRINQVLHSKERSNTRIDPSTLKVMRMHRVLELIDTPRAKEMLEASRARQVNLPTKD